MVGSRPGKWRHVVRRLSQSIVYRAYGERNDCPACGSHALFDLDVLPLRAGRTGFACGCDDCGLVFSNPQPSGDDLSHLYSPAGDWGSERAEADAAPAASTGVVGGSWTRLFDPIRDAVDVTAPPPGARVLDFGCGEGKLLDALQNCGWETWGIEPAFDTAFRRHRRLHEIPAEPRFDLILVVHVLEHVPNPLQLLQRFAAASRPGGHLLVGVPRLDTLPTHRDYQYVLNGRVHITAYTWACLRTLLVRAGWAPVAEPPAEISKGGGRKTTSRLRVLARRTVENPAYAAGRPGEEARAAVRGYYGRQDSRPWPARAGLLRLAARRADAQRRRSKALRRAAKQVTS
jgi:SAM-dependent methyltransferase